MNGTFLGRDVVFVLCIALSDSLMSLHDASLYHYRQSETVVFAFQHQVL